MKIRNDFVTNSSSSSFILAFKDSEQACSEIGKVFMKKLQEQNEWYDEDAFQRAIGKVLAEMKNGERTDYETVIDEYIDSISWYPVRFDVEKKCWEDAVHFPRTDRKDFNKRYEKQIDELRDQKLKELKKEMIKWMKENPYVSTFELDDSWPDNYAHDLCKSIGEEHMKNTHD